MFLEELMKKIIFLIFFTVILNSAAMAIIFNGTKLKGVIMQGAKLMPLGDSITLGFADDVAPFMGYRNHLQDFLGINVYDFVGPFNVPTSIAPPYDTAHAGHNGDTSTGVLSDLIKDLSTYFSGNNSNNTGSIILIHIGTNDVGIGITPTTTKNNVQSMINDISATDPTISIYVALIIPSKTNPSNANITLINAAVKPMVQTLQASKSNLYLVDMHSLWLADPNWQTDYMSSDPSAGVLHPNDVGYTVMAQQWANCIKSTTAQYCNGH